MTRTDDENISPNIYDSGFVESLFDEMAASYERVNYITSFGFSKRWRNQFIRRAPIRPGMVVCDLMSGMGECWTGIASAVGISGTIVAVDFSAGMLEGAKRRKSDFPGHRIDLRKENALNSSLPDSFADCVVSAFGLKTLDDDQLHALAREVRRLLKPAGIFTMVEVSAPTNKLLRALYMFYLKQVIPLIGRILLGHPENYRMLGIYTEKFGDCRRMAHILRENGLDARFEKYFFGSATGVTGTRSPS